MSNNSETYGVSDEALEVLGNLIGKINTIQKDIAKQAKSLIVVYDSNSNGLGRHAESIQYLIQMLIAYTEDNAPLNDLVKRLRKSYLIRSDYVKNNKVKTRK